MWIPKARTSKFSTAFAERILRESGTPRLSTRSSRAANCLRPAQVGVSVSGPSWGRGASQSGLMVSSKHHASWKRCRIGTRAGKSQSIRLASCSPSFLAKLRFHSTAVRNETVYGASLKPNLPAQLDARQVRPPPASGVVKDPVLGHLQISGHLFSGEQALRGIPIVDWRQCPLMQSHADLLVAGLATRCEQHTSSVDRIGFRIERSARMRRQLALG